MENFFIEDLGIPPLVFSFLIIPLMIFLARITDVSINTIRIIYVLGGRRMTATLLGFFESFIWLMAIRQIFANVNNWVCYVAYPAGFACGIFVGMLIEERIAYGKVIVRIITSKSPAQLIGYLTEQGFRYTHVTTNGLEGQENLIFTVLERERLNSVMDKLKELVPTAFYTVEKVNRASDNTLGTNQPTGGITSWLRTIRRE